MTEDPGLLTLRWVSSSCNLMANSAGRIMSGASVPVDSSLSEFSIDDSPFWYASLDNNMMV